MLVLKTLTRGAMHGYAIVEFIQLTSEDVLRVEEGALYPALHRLEVRGWLRSVARWSSAMRAPSSRPRTLSKARRPTLAPLKP